MNQDTIILNPKIVQAYTDGQNITILRLNGAGELMPTELTRIIEGIRYSIDHDPDHVKNIEIPGEVLKQALFGNKAGEFPEDELIAAIVNPKPLHTDKIKAKIVNFYMNERVYVFFTTARKPQQLLDQDRI